MILNLFRNWFYIIKCCWDYTE